MTDLLLFVFLLHLILLLPFFLLNKRLHFFSRNSALFFLGLSLFLFFAASLTGRGERKICEVAQGSAAWKAGLREGGIAPEGFAPVVPAKSVPWWWPKVAGDELERSGGYSVHCRPPVLRIEPSSSFLLQNSEFTRGARIISLGGTKVGSRSELRSALSALGGQDVVGLQFLAGARKQNLWLMKGWANSQEEGVLFSLGSPESGLVIYRARALSGLGDPLRPSFLPIRAVNEERVFSPLGLLQREGEIKTLLVGQKLENFGDYLPIGIVILPHFVEGPADGFAALEPLRLLWRISFAQGFSWVNLAREWKALPKAWYQIDSLAFQSVSYWIFRLACVAFLLCLFAGLGLSARRRGSFPLENRPLLLGVALLGTALLMKDLFVILVL